MIRELWFMWILMKHFGEMEQNISLSLNDILKMPVCCEGFSNAKIYCITAKHQQDPEGLDDLKILCQKGHLNNIIKLEGEKGWEKQCTFF